MRTLLTLLLMALWGCGKPPVANQPDKSDDSGLLEKVGLRPSKFGPRHHGHPTVRQWYIELHGQPHTFNCEDMSPDHEPYECRECPVGDPARVVEFKHGYYLGVPDEINVWSACEAINMLIPEPSSWHDSDEFLCSRTPMDGSVVIAGKKYSCARPSEEKKQNLGDLQPKELQ